MKLSPTRKFEQQKTRDREKKRQIEKKERKEPGIPDVEGVSIINIRGGSGKGSSGISCGGMKASVV